MIRQILLCTDGSVYSVVATEYALWLSKRLGAHLVGLHISDIRQLEWPLLADLSGSIGAQPYLGALAQIQQYHKDKARAVLDGFKDLAGRRGVSCSTVHKTGRLTELVLEEEENADVVVLGQRGEHAEQTGEMMGSSVERIVRRSVKPCLVTPGKFRDISKILIAHDGSEHSTRSLCTGLNLTTALGLSATIVTVEEDDAMASSTYLDGAVSLAKKQGVACRGQVLKGDAETEILRCVEREKMDLIVMGAYGHTRMREFVLGSTTSHVIRKAKVPVLLTR